jgi:cobalamin biosynthesis protein CobT
LEDRKKVLPAEAVDGPENQAQNDAEEEGGGERKGDGPASSAPGEVTGKASQRDVKSNKNNDDDTHNDEQKAEEDEDAAEIGHVFLEKKRCQQFRFKSDSFLAPKVCDMCSK